MLNIRNCLLFGIMILSFACKSISLQNVTGKYFKAYKKKGSYKQTISLELNQDSTFNYCNKYFEASLKCKGRWSVISKDTVSLKCFDEEGGIINLITQGYMTEREKKVKIINKNRVTIDNSLLKRVR